MLHFTSCAQDSQVEEEEATSSQEGGDEGEEDGEKVKPPSCVVTL